MAFGPCSPTPPSWKDLASQVLPQMQPVKNNFPRAFWLLPGDRAALRLLAQPPWLAAAALLCVPDPCTEARNGGGLTAGHPWLPWGPSQPPGKQAGQDGSLSPNAPLDSGGTEAQRVGLGVIRELETGRQGLRRGWSRQLGPRLLQDKHLPQSSGGLARVSRRGAAPGPQHLRPSRAPPRPQGDLRTQMTGDQRRRLRKGSEARGTGAPCSVPLAQAGPGDAGGRGAAS